MKEPVYLAGCYRNRNHVEKIKNVLHATQVAQEFAEKGITFVSPITHTAYFDDACPKVPQGFWLELGMILLQNCKSIYMMKGWQNSEGAKKS